MKVVRAAAFLLGLGAFAAFLAERPFDSVMLDGWARSGTGVDGLILILSSLWRPWANRPRTAMVAALGYYAGDNSYVALTWLDHGWHLPVGFVFQIVPTAVAWIACAYCVISTDVDNS